MTNAATTAGGKITLAADGTYTYTPAANFFGTDTYVYQVCDNGSPALCANGTLTITVTPMNDAPVAGNDNATTAEDQTLTASVAGNDGDVDHTAAQLTYALVTGSTAATNGTLTFNPDGSYSYVPNANYNGTVSFTYQVCDPDNACATATVTITVTAVNDAPVLATVGSKVTDEMLALTFTVTAADADMPANTLTFTLATPATGTYPTGAAINAATKHLAGPRPKLRDRVLTG